ncbi:MAG: hypothetical protein IPO07_15875 [Haliscomenobacter sp.]|nr:hypothetical protein [Haliscomenobacter sp.]MBK9490079.1 hypothetical protein [Haliscomenobacter sp.]
MDFMVKKSAGSINNPACCRNARSNLPQCGRRPCLSGVLALPRGKQWPNHQHSCWCLEQMRFPKNAAGLGGDNLPSEVQHQSTCKWEKTAGRWDADALCTGSPGNSPYVFVGEK